MRRTWRDRRAGLDTVGIVGAVLLVGGVAVALYAHSQVTELQGVVGTLGRALDPDRRERYELMKQLRIGAGVAAALGLVGLVVELSGD